MVVRDFDHVLKEKLEPMIIKKMLDVPIGKFSEPMALLIMPKLRSHCVGVFFTRRVTIGNHMPIDTELFGYFY